MHALVAAILLRMARLDAFNANPQPEPPDRELAQVEQGALVVLGFRKQDITYYQWVIEQGSLLFTGAIIFNFGVGFSFLATLPSVVRLNFSGGNGLATGLLGRGCSYVWLRLRI
jgi:hypothetical protein